MNFLLKCNLCKCSIYFRIETCHERPSLQHISHVIFPSETFQFSSLNGCICESI